MGLRIAVVALGLLACSTKPEAKPTLDIPLSVDGSVRDALAIAPGETPELTTLLTAKDREWRVLRAYDKRGEVGVTWYSSGSPGRRVVLGLDGEGAYIAWSKPGTVEPDPKFTHRGVSRVELDTTGP